MPRGTYITTEELKAKTAGGINYIRTKDGVVKALALNPRLNPNAPDVVLVGRGKRIESSAQLFLASGKSMPLYVKRAINSWELIGDYRATEYLTDKATIRTHHSHRPIDTIAGVLFLERTDEEGISVKGGGFADPKARKEIEEAAIGYVTRVYEREGYKIESHEKYNRGYDLLATKMKEVLHLEVKGTGGAVERFFLTRNEKKCAVELRTWRLCLVTNAKINPEMTSCTFAQIGQKYQLDALAWECTVADQ